MVATSRAYVSFCFFLDSFQNAYMHVLSQLFWPVCFMSQGVSPLLWVIAHDLFLFVGVLPAGTY